MNGLIYSERENILFYVWRNEKDIVERVENVESVIDQLRIGAELFAETASTKADMINTFVIMKSERNRGHRCFWIKTNHPPKNVLRIGGDWFMHAWIKYVA